MIEAALCALTVLMLGAMLLGPSLLYAFLGLAFIGASGLLAISPDWRSSLGSYFRSASPILLVAAGFSLVFFLVIVFSPIGRLKEASELKWTLIWMALFVPCASLYRLSAFSKWGCWVLGGLLFFVVLSGVAGLVEFITRSSPFREAMGWTDGGFEHRATGFLRNPIPFGHAMGSLFWVGTTGMLMALVKGRRKWAVVAGIVCVIGFGSVLVSQTRGAWLAIAIVGILSIFILRGRIRTLWMAGLVIAGVAGLLVVSFSPETRERLMSGFSSTETANRYRLEMWHANYEILSEHPLGIGYGSNDDLIDGIFDRLGYDSHEYMGHSHNEFIEIAVGSGWLGLALYLCFTGMLLYRSVRAFRLTDSAKDPWRAFLLLSSILVQIFINACALTDQMSTPGRFLLCMAWAFAIVIPMEVRRNEEVGTFRYGER